MNQHQNKVLITPEAPKTGKPINNKAFKERHAEMFRQYSEHLKGNLTANSKILLDGLKNVSSNLYELDRPFKRYYENDVLKPLPEISSALRGDFEFYGSPTSKSTYSNRKIPSRPEDPSNSYKLS